MYHVLPQKFSPKTPYMHKYKPTMGDEWQSSEVESNELHLLALL